RILQTIANREINIVNPCLITSDANVGPLVEVLLNVPKDGDSNLINIPDTDEEEDRTKDASIQSCEEDHNDLNELPKLDTEKEKCSNKIAQEGETPIKVENGDSELACIPNDNDQDNALYQSDDSVDQSDILDNFVEKVI